MRYPGLKEDVYVHRFRPDRSILNKLGISADDLVVTVRPPANEAHYHNPESDKLFAATLRFLGDKPHLRAVTLPRNAKQSQQLQKDWAELVATGRMVIPKTAVDGLNLIWFSDLVISGGGTMNREAAALGVPAYSIFRGAIGAVDQHLAQQGRLVLIETARDVESKIRLTRWNRPSEPDRCNPSTLRNIVSSILEILYAGQRIPSLRRQVVIH
jgi:predicted glycosyltransferase